MPECGGSENHEGQVDYSNHLPIGISKLLGPIEVGAGDELHYFGSGEVEGKVQMKYQLVE
jgi:hypothetical protein